MSKPKLYKIKRKLFCKMPSQKNTAKKILMSTAALYASSSQKMFRLVISVIKLYAQNARIIFQIQKIENLCALKNVKIQCSEISQEMKLNQEIKSKYFALLIIANINQSQLNLKNISSINAMICFKFSNVPKNVEN